MYCVCGGLLQHPNYLSSFLWLSFMEVLDVDVINCSNNLRLIFQLKKRKHYCGICKKIRNPSDSGTWVRNFLSFAGRL